MAAEVPSDSSDTGLAGLKNDKAGCDSKSEIQFRPSLSVFVKINSVRLTAALKGRGHEQ